MNDILSPDFLRRLHMLRDRLHKVLDSFDISHSGAGGHWVTPELESHRHYTRGDDTRYIDWSLYARHDRFYLKTMVMEEEGYFHVMVDTSASMRSPFPEKQLRAVEVAAGLSYLAMIAGARVRLYAWSDHILSFSEYPSGESEIRKLLIALAGLPKGRGTRIAPSLEDLVHLPSSSGSKAVLLSDFMDLEPYEGQLNLLHARGIKTAAVQILHPRETRPFPRGNLILHDPESGNTRRRLAGYRSTRQFEKVIMDHLANTHSLFRRKRVGFIRSLCDRTFEEIVMDYTIMTGRGN